MDEDVINIVITVGGRTYNAAIAKTLIDDTKPLGIDAVKEIAAALAEHVFKDIKGV